MAGKKSLVTFIIRVIVSFSVCLLIAANFLRLHENGHGQI